MVCVNIQVPFHLELFISSRTSPQNNGSAWYLLCSASAVLSFAAVEITSGTDTQEADDLREVYLQGLAEPSVLTQRTEGNLGCSGRGVHFKGRNH